MYVASNISKPKEWLHKYIFYKGNVQVDKCIQWYSWHYFTYCYIVPLAALFGNITTNHPRRIGNIDPNCDVIECVSSKYKDLLRFIVMKHYILINHYIYLKRTHISTHRHISRYWWLFSHLENTCYKNWSVLRWCLNLKN